MNKYKAIDLFCGCGGLSEGFLQTKKFDIPLHIDWDKAPLQTLKHRLKTKWNHKDPNESVLQFDLQDVSELLTGWYEDNDQPHPLSKKGIGRMFKKGELDFIVGGPPCQAYSIAGRIRCPDGMKNDYRNYLFESYVKLVTHFRPKIFVFENVPGMLSASPGGIPITERIKESFEDAEYTIIENFKEAVFNTSDYGVPQDRKRVILVGVDTKRYGKKASQSFINDFYKNFMPSLKIDTKTTVRDAISHLPKLTINKKDDNAKVSHLTNEFFPNHTPRFHSQRDIKAFQLLAKDKLNKVRKYDSTESLKALYTELTGKKSNVHKYCVQEWDKPSKTIVAHLYKDGLRHIHPDHKQGRSLTVRECAALQTFDDDFVFTESMGANYKMIGNAVPPKFAKLIATVLSVQLEAMESKRSTNFKQIQKYL
ncbi:DNA cytosine methyltransferase [Halobacteriovorax sp. HFRX-2_2]|uniref:DNA cytosine methyltransferase n=1 Tax=unclassified Halobacteriovorax TaxID=2639665 RepID=UPI0037221797